MKKVKLTQGKYSIVDDEDYTRVVSAGSWCAVRAYKNIWYAKNRQTYLHNFVLKTKWVDHINGDGLDNRKSNLRECNRSSNAMNKRKQANTSSSYKGVYWNKRAKKWQAQIWKDQTPHHIGIFDSEIEAAQSYNRVAKEMFGVYAKLNDI